MAFGYEYWMVYLPEFNPDSFLLFVHNPSGSTKLRDYSDGRERVLGQPMLGNVRQATEWGRTRFEETPHTVSGRDGQSHWGSRISEYNRRYLASVRRVDVAPQAHASLASAIAMNNRGRANRGSQRQLQDYVNLEPRALDAAIVSALPPRIQQSSPQIQWLSPLAAQQFREYRDAEFLAVLGLGRYSGELSRFWPERGPCWDGLALLTTALPGSLPIALLVEAKSHVPEVYGDGCQAGAMSRTLIQRSLGAAKKWCGAAIELDWTGPLYQSANRIAHLYFLKGCLNLPCFLVNLYFVDDPYRPTSRSEWASALEVAHAELGLTKPVPGLVEVILPARAFQYDGEASSPMTRSGAELGNGSSSESSVRAAPSPSLGEPLIGDALNGELSFAAWCRQWKALATFHGPTLPDPEARIQHVANLWHHGIPGRWQRCVDPQLLESRYRRGDLRSPRMGEHAIEYQILVEQFGKVSVLGGQLVDGVNAFPLACDFAGGGRCGNVEADMLLASELKGDFRLWLCEVKSDADNPWFAAIESLLQMRLFLSNPVGQRVMEQRGVVPVSATEPAVTGLVLAQAAYYCSRGKKINSVEPAKRLLDLMRRRFGVDIRFAVWAPDFATIREL